MRKLVALLGAALFALAATPTSARVQHEVLAPSPIELSDCFMCAKDSTGACSGADECTSSRSECTKMGCKITGTRSCSTSANVKKC